MLGLRLDRCLIGSDFLFGGESRSGAGEDIKDLSCRICRQRKYHQRPWEPSLRIQVPYIDYKKQGLPRGSTHYAIYPTLVSYNLVSLVVMEGFTKLDPQSQVITHTRPIQYKPHSATPQHCRALYQTPQYHTGSATEAHNQSTL